MYWGRWVPCTGGCRGVGGCVVDVVIRGVGGAVHTAGWVLCRGCRVEGGGGASVV